MAPAARFELQRVRTVMALRLTGVLCLALALPGALRGAASIVVGINASLTLAQPGLSYSDRFLELLGTLHWQNTGRWIASHGASLLLLALGAYLWKRRPEQLVRRREPFE